MDSKSIAREGVPVRLRDPVLDPDETLGFVGVFLSTCRNARTRKGRKSRKTRAGERSANNGERGDGKGETTASILTFDAVVMFRQGARRASAEKIRAERQEKPFFLGRGGVIFAKIDYNSFWTTRRRFERA